MLEKWLICPIVTLYKCEAKSGVFLLFLRGPWSEIKECSISSRPSPQTNIFSKIYLCKLQ